MKTTFHFEQRRDGELIDTFSEEGGSPQLVPRPSDDLGDLARRRPVRAAACIYCGSNEPRSREHVIPKAWGGTLVIGKGSCEACRKRTSAFEDHALNEGTMREVRRARGWGSRSGHSQARDTLPFTIIQDGTPQQLEVLADEAPLLLGLPTFTSPALLELSSRQQLALDGWVVASFGPDPEEFLRSHGATAIHFKEDHKRAVAFAQTLAKIAYGYAWSDGLLELLPGLVGLLNAFMHRPETLGQWVGTKPGPFEQAPPRTLFSLRYALDARTRHIMLEIQPFADIGAPTYLVVLGHCRTLREWRRVRDRIPKGFFTRRTASD